MGILWPVGDSKIMLETISGYKIRVSKDHIRYIRAAEGSLEIDLLDVSEPDFDVYQWIVLKDSAKNWKVLTELYNGL